MARFAFRLQRVLEHRRREVEDAKAGVGRATAAIVDVERCMEALTVVANRSVQVCGGGVHARLDLQAHLEAVDAEARSLEIERMSCEEDLDRARVLLRTRMAELGAIEVLEEKDRRVWLYEEARREQNALDEWATMRRTPVAA